MTIFIILFAHWIADFVCQTHKMATNKSKSLLALLSHVFAYTLVLSLFILSTVYIVCRSQVDDIVPLLFTGLAWCLIQGALHGIVDFFTRGSMSLYNGIFYWCTIQTEQNGVGHRGWVCELQLPSFDCYRFLPKSEEIHMRISPGQSQYIPRDKIVSFVVDFNKRKRMFWEE